MSTRNRTRTTSPKKRRGTPRTSTRTQRRSKPSRWSNSPGQINTIRSAFVAPMERLDLVTINNRNLTTTGLTITERWNPNAVYQPLVGGPTGQVTGFARWSALYTFYRVVSYSYIVQFINYEAFAVTVWTQNSSNDPGTSGGLSNANNRLSNQFTLEPKGSGGGPYFLTSLIKPNRTGTIPISTILGSRAVATDSDYRSLINNVPADVTWLGIGMQTTTGAPPVTGINYTLTLKMSVEFYSSDNQ